MKIIDLLNKIANGEEIPKKILFKDYVYCWKEGIDYERKDGGETTYLLSTEPITKYFLQREVEILDEPKKDKKIIKIKEENGWCGKQSTGNEIILKMKVNELIDEVNKLNGTR